MLQLPLIHSQSAAQPLSAFDFPAAEFGLKPQVELSGEIVSGSVERLVSFSDEDGYAVFKVRIPGRKTHVVVKSHTPFLTVGFNVEAVGQWEKSNVGEGAVFLASHMRVFAPNSIRTVKKFLLAGNLRGIGPHYAALLADSFGANLFIVLKESPEDLLAIPGIGLQRQRQILERWNEYVRFISLRHYLFQHRLPLTWSYLLWELYGGDAIFRLSDTPYDFYLKHGGLNFNTVDNYALSIGGSPDALDRMRAGLRFEFYRWQSQGHCAVPEFRLVSNTAHLLRVESLLVEEVLDFEILDGEFVRDKINGVMCVSASEIWHLEQRVAERLINLNRETPAWGWFNFHKVMAWAQELLRLQLAPLQRDAIQAALTSPITVITGGPGTGKTTLIRALVAILHTQHLKFTLCSPTGRATQRLEEASGTRAHTIHRLLKYDGHTGDFGFNEHQKLDLDLILIDEASMVDLPLMAHLLNALPEKCGVIMIGDVDQIPPVGAGHVLKSIIDSRQFTTVRLTDIYRQSQESLIKLNAHRINNGEMPLVSPKDTRSDFHFLSADNDSEAKDILFHLLKKTIPLEFGISDLRDIQVLVPLNRGSIGTHVLNRDLQARLNPSANESIEGFGHKLCVGDKVMVIRNDYAKEVFNGDIGIIADITHIEQFVTVRFGTREVRFAFKDLDQLTLAYAISIHKSQGSEYRAVIVLLTQGHVPAAQRHLLYTAVTRGKEQVFLIGNLGVIQKAIANNDGQLRWQRLTRLLRNKNESASST